MNAHALMKGRRISGSGLFITTAGVFFAITAAAQAIGPNLKVAAFAPARIRRGTSWKTGHQSRQPAAKYIACSRCSRPVCKWPDIPGWSRSAPRCAVSSCLRVAQQPLLRPRRRRPHEIGHERCTRRRARGPQGAAQHLAARDLEVDRVEDRCARDRPAQPGRGELAGEGGTGRKRARSTPFGMVAMRPAGTP